MKMEMTFGEKIKLLREEASLSQTQLGNELGMSQRRISYIECGKYEPNLEDIRLFCCFFDVTADYLLGLQDKKRNG